MPDKFIITRSTPELESALETILDFIRKAAPGVEPSQSATVRYAIITAASEIRMQAGETKMYSISIDNGLSTTTPEKAISKLGMDVIRNMMDDDICAQVECQQPRNDVEFINLYLKHAPIVIG